MPMGHCARFRSEEPDAYPGEPDDEQQVANADEAGDEEGASSGREEVADEKE
jgi:hypothetical protein